VGRDPAERRALAARLLASEKDRAEHRWVVDEMVERLGEVATDIRAAETPHVLTLARIQHLETEIRARVPTDRHVLDMVEALHPTPAVCGVPRDAALELLQREEPFDRGWYAGPVGWFATDGDGHFVPALRTAVGDGRRWRLFAGAGIVDGSSAQGEWDETGIKFQPVLRALEACGARVSQTGER
jgi:menaquinone-specific isochorismate synthase